MLFLTERLGWRIQKHDEETVQHFCNETGVKRHVLKVWMHNNKHTLGDAFTLDQHKYACDNLAKVAVFECNGVTTPATPSTPVTIN